MINKTLRTTRPTMTDGEARALLEPFHGAYDAVRQPHLLDMPREQLTEDYLKWRPKLVQQLSHLHQRGLLCNHVADGRRWERLRVLADTFEKMKWVWKPIGVQNRYLPPRNELHDVPLDWQSAHEVEQLTRRVSQLEAAVARLMSTKFINKTNET